MVKDGEIREKVALIIRLLGYLEAYADEMSCPEFFDVCQRVRRHERELRKIVTEEMK